MIVMIVAELARGTGQGALRRDVEVFAGRAEGRPKSAAPRTIDCDHGRIETRSYTAFHELPDLQEHHYRPGLRDQARNRRQKRAGDPLLTSLPGSAAKPNRTDRPQPSDLKVRGSLRPRRTIFSVSASWIRPRHRSVSRRESMPRFDYPRARGIPR